MNGASQHAMNGFHSNSGASTSSSPFPDYQPTNQSHSHFANNRPLQPPPSQPHQVQHMPQHNSLWNPQPSMNAQLPQQINQHAFNPQQWMNTMNQHPFPNGMHPMPGFNMPFLPPQVLQDALAMSAPVESADEPTLVQHLLNGLRRGETHKDVLNSLHGKNGHSASLWKDYYLDHKERIDSWVNMTLQKQSIKSADRIKESTHHKPSFAANDVIKKTIKKPSPASFKLETSPGVYSLSSVSAPVKKLKQPEQRTTPKALAQASGTHRSTINSLTAPAPVFGSRLPPPNADIKVPDAPSRSPSPPTRVIPHRGRGNKYTNEDRDFFIKFIGWRLKSNPDLTRQELCELLAERAPHHTAQSWASHWSNNHDIPDKILAAARGDEYQSDGNSSDDDDEEEEEEEEEERNPPPRKRPRYRDPSSSDDEKDTGDESLRSTQRGQSVDVDSESEGDDDKPLRHWNESEMGSKGGPFTDADLYITARYIASSPNWESTTSKDRWTPYSEKYPQRSSKSWAEYYRRNDNALDKMVKKIREEAANSESGISSSQVQRARPTRTPPRMKRKFNLDDE